MEKWATKEGFFKCQVPRERKEVPGLGDIWIYGLTSGEKDEYEDKVISVRAGTREVKMKNARAVLMQLTVRNQHGALMFGPADIGKLIPVPAAVADPILDIARRLSGMQVGEIEELVKNSDSPDPKAGENDSGSASPKPEAGR
jgi:hypothetical protein